MKQATLKLVRDVFSDTETLGSLFLNGKFFCYTLEDKVRDLTKEKKVHGSTAIPAGKYTIVLEYSNRFKRILPEIKGVKTHSETKLHGGNTHLNTDGCPLVAYNRYVNKPHPTIAKIKNWIQGSAEKDLVKALQQFDSIILIVT